MGARLAHQEAKNRIKDVKTKSLCADLDKRTSCKGDKKNPVQCAKNSNIWMDAQQAWKDAWKEAKCATIESVQCNIKNGNDKKKGNDNDVGETVDSECINKFEAAPTAVGIHYNRDDSTCRVVYKMS